MSIIVHNAVKIFGIEIDCLRETSNNLSYGFLNAFIKLRDCILSNHKVIVTGVGKSGFIARKIAATMTSTGTKAIFLNPNEAIHGDIGIASKGDVVIAISKSGKSQEILNIIPHLRKIGIDSLISIVGNMESPLAEESNIKLYTPVKEEVDQYNIVPTSSTTAALVMGDALAISLMGNMDFTDEDFLRLHPAGSLGRGLSIKVSDLVIKDVQSVGEFSLIKEILEEMNRKSVGGVVVGDRNNSVIGVITEGDIRRAILNICNFKKSKAFEIMTKIPITVNLKDTTRYALGLMEYRDSQISILPVVDDNNIFQGVIRLHDIVRLGI